MYLCAALHGHGTSAAASSSGTPTECSPRTKSPVRAQRLQHPRAHARHDVHRDHHVRRIGDLHADLGDRRANRAHRVGNHIHRAAAHRAGEQPGRGLLFISAGSAQLLVGPASSSRVGADERELLDPGDIAGIGAAEVRIRPRSGMRRIKVPVSTISWQRRSYSSAEPSHQWIASGWVSPATSSTQSRRP